MANIAQHFLRGVAFSVSNSQAYLGNEYGYADAASFCGVLLGAAFGRGNFLFFAVLYGAGF